ncbi:MFS transporter [Streptomyces cyaneofuscatus]|uniref:MFS transporter n=1 Tax=Streptomyces cyaneofuscatus TaxID=66883 RepID=UPI00378DB46A
MTRRYRPPPTLRFAPRNPAITFAALLLVTGRLSDLYGARRIFLLGLVVFGATSMPAALAPSGGLLIPARSVQGVGGAMPTS